METEDRFIIPAPLNAFIFPLALLGLAGAAIYYGVKNMPESPEYAALILVGLLLALASYFLYCSSSRPLILDKKTDRVLGYPHELSKALKVVTKDGGSSSDRWYVVELVFPDGRLPLTRAGWGYSLSSDGPDDVAKKIGAFLGIPAEPRFKWSVSYSFSKGLHLTEAQAKDAEKAGIKVDPKAIK